jgi:hypothetical protein
MRQLKEITSVLETQGYNLTSIIFGIMKEFKLRHQCDKAGIRKAEGFDVLEILRLMLLLPVMALKNVHQLYKSEYSKAVEMRKDTLYRFKNNENYSWRTFLYGVAKIFKRITKQSAPMPPEPPVTAFILDDTTDARTGYKLENISWIYDHVLKKSVLGFKTLVLCFFDGISTIPLDFTIHQEKALCSKRRKSQYKKQVSDGSQGAKRRKESKTSKIKQSVVMLKRAVKQGFFAQYLLCDSWFTCEELISAVRQVAGGKMHLIAGVKKDNRKYGYGGGLFNAKQIISDLKKTKAEKRCRRLNIRYYESIVNYKGIGNVKLVICRYPGQRDWRAFVTTDTGLTFVKMMEIYAIRWTIEVFFRECKQYLGFGTWQSQDFDAQISGTTLCFVLYTLLAYRKRKMSYESPQEDVTTGQLLLEACKDLREKNLAERIFELFNEILIFLIEVISEKGVMDISQLMNSQEYLYAKDLLRSSFLFEQFKSVDNAV